MTNRNLYEQTIEHMRNTVIEIATMTPGYIPSEVAITVHPLVWKALAEGAFHDPRAIVGARTIRIGDRFVIHQGIPIPF